jgi:hypothetical protein
VNAGDWILLERSNGWAAALRTAFLRESPDLPQPRIYEVRRLDDLSTRLNARPASLVLIEVARANVSAMLEWLAITAPRFPAARFAALLDGEFAEKRLDRQDALDALIEAGICEFAVSPRQIRDILALGRLHAEIAVSQRANAESPSLQDWAWASLPWQEA